MPSATISALPRPTLYGAPGWGSTLVEAMLAVAGVEFDFVDVEGFDTPGPMRDTILALNPLAQIPVLVCEDGGVMTESAAIALWLSERFPESGLAPPPGSPERARFLRYLVWLVTNVYATFTYADYPERWAPGDADTLRDTVIDYRKRLWRWFEGEARAPWVLGATMSVLDIYVAIMIRWRPNRPWFEAHAPGLVAIADRAAAHPAIAPVIARNFPD
ncbi:glutathione S-transferase family protein [Sphingomonas sp. LaA6.9]|uniref:glutathione S-transferase family protein n=1 Tax=Sphingomonas sp. LaA6.9 TaxID=2919914 RepID=UPI001F4FFFF8|nr:glutathione S-transferase family protein [Sphingomonas sp. LaA6.9]MCJ8156971.1 glutathione S-transferase family protein [Sphingomonas sp. LaA6.9]